MLLWDAAKKITFQKSKKIQLLDESLQETSITKRISESIDSSLAYDTQVRPFQYTTNITIKPNKLKPTILTTIHTMDSFFGYRHLPYCKKRF